MRRFLKTIFLTGFVLYTVVCIVLYFYQDRLIFNPDKLPEDFQFRMGQELEIEVDEGVFLNNIFLSDSRKKGVILYLHGNRGSNRRCIRQAEMFRDMGYDIIMPDYRGYGKSDGYIYSEKQMYNDVQKVYDYLKSKYDESQIVVIGYSLGTGMASYLAAHNNPAQLFLIAPYVSFIDLKDMWTSLIPDFLVKYPLDNKKHLEQTKTPVTLFHGTDDEVIPYQSSVLLSNISPINPQLITLNSTGHRRSIFHNKMRSTVTQILSN